MGAGAAPLQDADRVAICTHMQRDIDFEASPYWRAPADWGGDWDPIDLTRENMAEGGIAPRELAACVGSQPHCSAVLSRRRGLPLPMIRGLHEKLGIPADLLIRECRQRRGRTRDRT